MKRILIILLLLSCISLSLAKDISKEEQIELSTNQELIEFPTMKYITYEDVVVPKKVFDKKKFITGISMTLLLSAIFLKVCYDIYNNKIKQYME